MSRGERRTHEPLLVDSRGCENLKKKCKKPLDKFPKVRYNIGTKKEKDGIKMIEFFKQFLIYYYATDTIISIIVVIISILIIIGTLVSWVKHR